jgi:hypothetical protein
MAVAAVVVQLQKRPPPREEPEVKVAVMVAAEELGHAFQIVRPLAQQIQAAAVAAALHMAMWVIARMRSTTLVMEKQVRQVL